MGGKRIVARCPVCDSDVVISEVHCEACGTSLRGRFEIPILCQLPDEHYQFLMVFIKNRGVIRDVERELGVSYPTVRARLDAVLTALGFRGKMESVQASHVIEMLERGEISADEAEKLLRGGQ